MRSVKIAQLKDHLSEHLRAVEGGDEVLVMDRDRPIARIVPVSPAPYVPRLIPPKRPFAPDHLRVAPADLGVSSTELLLEERGDR